ncbi:unnamed protein product [Discosporangium mesarthrocarpum]
MDQPSWMQSSAGAAGAPAGSTPAGGTSGATRQVNPTSGENGTFIRTIFHFLNIGLSVMMAASAVVSIMALSSFELQRCFLAIYLLIFAVLLFMYEMVRVVMRCEGPHQIMLKNFGFFFGAKGRGFYLVFVGFLNFPLNTPLSFWTGLATLGWGIVTIVAYMMRPEWFEVPKPAQAASG